MSPTAMNQLTKVTMPSDVETVITRTFNAPRPLVFEVRTDCKHLPHWMYGPDDWKMTSCQMELAPGGPIHWVWGKPTGETMQITGTVKEVAAPERIDFTECWGEDWPETLDTVLFTEESGATTVELRMLFPSKAARDAAMETGMTDGTDMSYNRLDAYLASLG